jgi:SAM-dependent methyltransferase
MGNRQGFPLLYDAHQGAFAEDLPFWIKMANANPNPVLELGCGTGRVALELVKLGHQMVGIDNDLSMLQFLNDRIRKKRISNLLTFQGDMSAFHLNQKFGVIITPCNTLSTLTAANRQNTLGCVFSHLLPNGMFSASMPNPAWVKNLPNQVTPEIDHIFYHPQDHNPVQVSSSWSKSQNNLRITWHYDHLKPDGRVERTTIQVVHFLEPVNVYQADLINAGFTSITMYGDFEFSPYNPESELLILVARRPDTRTIYSYKNNT